MPEKTLIVFSPPHDSKELPEHPKLQSVAAAGDVDGNSDAQSEELASVDDSEE